MGAALAISFCLIPQAAIARLNPSLELGSRTCSPRKLLVKHFGADGGRSLADGQNKEAWRKVKELCRSLDWSRNQYQQHDDFVFLDRKVNSISMQSKRMKAGEKQGHRNGESFSEI
jgi:hypothetical protein